MSKLLEVLDVNQNGNTLTMKLKSLSPTTLGQTSEISPEFVLCGLVKLKIKNVLFSVISSGNYYLKSQRGLIKVAKVFKSDNFIYSIRLTLSMLQKLEESEILVGDNDNFGDATWQMFYEGGGDENTTIQRISEYNLKISLIGSCKFNGFPSLYDDTDLSDFKLLGRDGSISVHKAVLAQFSPVMKTMLIGQWKEVKDEAVEIPDTSKETLQQLKDFMYLQKMPESGIEKLAKLASCYMMSDLEEVCTYKLLTSLNSENAIKTLELAVTCRMERLMIAIMVINQNNLIKVEDMISKFESKVKVFESKQESESKA